jgi:hypothetical protein
VEKIAVHLPRVPHQRLEYHTRQRAALLLADQRVVEETDDPGQEDL